MIIRCCNRFICPDPDFPIANLSSEDPDQNLFIGWSAFWDRNQPPILTRDYGPQPPFICEDGTSQATADLCAKRHQLECTVLGNCPPGNNFWVPTPPLFYSAAFTATVTCPDGSPFSYTLPAGSCVALHQADADLMAQSLAGQFAKSFKLCIEISNQECCFGQPTTIFIAATGLSLSTSNNNLWALTAGSIPNGMTLQQGEQGVVVTLSGTPTEAGAFAFEVTLLTPAGDTIARTFTLCVINIITAETLVPGNIGSFYNEPILATGCAATPRHWAVVGGSLPPGLTLDTLTGVISGVPTGLPASYNFTVRLTT